MTAEFVLGSHSPESAHSMDVGCVRMTERDVREIIGVAGTITTITAHALRLDRYDAGVIHRARLPIATMLDACEDIASMPRTERAALPYLHPGRVDVIAAGATVWATVVHRIVDAVAGSGNSIDTVVTSEHDILDGVALSLT